jgi:hypothetical protein
MSRVSIAFGLAVRFAGTRLRRELRLASRVRPAGVVSVVRMGAASAQTRATGSCTLMHRQPQDMAALTGLDRERDIDARRRVHRHIGGPSGETRQASSMRALGEGLVRALHPLGLIAGALVRGGGALNGASSSRGAAANGGHDTHAPSTPGSSVFAPAPATLRKLTVEQYRNSVQDLLGPGLDLPSDLEPDTAQNGFIAIGAARATSACSCSVAPTPRRATSRSRKKTCCSQRSFMIWA